MKKLIAGIFALSFSFAANAESVQLKFDGVNTTIGSSVKINYAKQNVAMGSYNFTEGLSPNSKHLVGFCVDPFEYASSSFKTYEKSGLDATDFDSNGAARLINVQKLFDNAYATLGSAVETAGFHLALWELFNDDGNLSTGLVQKAWDSNASMVSVAQGFLNSMSGWLVTDKYKLTFYGNEGYYEQYKQFNKWCQKWVPGKQDYLIPELNPPKEVPLPAALPMLLSGLLGLGLMGSRRKV